MKSGKNITRLSTQIAKALAEKRQHFGNWLQRRWAARRGALIRREEWV
jgi:hypothetical protein